MALEGKLQNLSRLSALEQQVQFTSLADELIAGGSSSGLMTLGKKLLSEDIPIQVTRSVLTHIASSMKSLSEEQYYEVSVYLIGVIKQHPGAPSLDEADFILRDTLFTYCVACEEYTEAAQFLAGANLDSATRVFSELEKVDIYIKCAEAVLEADEAIDAEIYVNKASALINAAAENSQSSVDEIYGQIQLRFRVTYARVLDANRKFVEAAVRYYGLSTTTGYNVLQDDLLELLGKAVTCAILGKAGQQRTRVLALLVKDDRLGELDTHPKYGAHRTVLLKMHLEQLIRKSELESFTAVLMPHQKAVAGDGFSLLDRAVMEHNMISLSRIYCNIPLPELGNMLDLDSPDRAEKIAAAMITEGRLSGFIDQTSGFLVFEAGNGAHSHWTNGIEDVCKDITEFTDSVARCDQQEVA